MEAVGVLVLIINLILLLVIMSKTKEFRDTKDQYLSMQNNLEEMAQENSRVIDLILYELECKLQESQKVISYFEENTFIVPEAGEVLPYLKQKNLRNPSALPKEKERSESIVDLFKEGLEAKDIAERLHITEGEVLLKINLYRKSLLSASQMR